MSIQGKLLRVLQEKEIRRVGSNETVSIDARVLAATNTPLEQLLKEGTFREDLYYRLSVIPILIRPLRERRDDILPLVSHILQKEAREDQEPISLDSEVANILESYNWAGNVRELENAVRHALTFAKENVITKEVLPARILENPAMLDMSVRKNKAEEIDLNKCKSLKAFLRTKEKDYLAQILAFAGGDKEQAAKALDISLATLYRKLPDADMMPPPEE